MIKEYFITNYLFKILKIKINKKYLILIIKSYVKVPKYYYNHILTSIYDIFPHSTNIKIYNKFHKIIILKYLL